MRASPGPRTPQLVWFLFAVYGTYYALTEGVMKAWIADLAPGRFARFGLRRLQLGGGSRRVSRELYGGMDLAALLARRALSPFPAFLALLAGLMLLLVQAA